MGLANLIQLELSGDEPGRADAQQIIAVAERASSLTKKLLALSHSGLETPSTLDANETLRDLFKMLRRTLSKDIELVSLLAEQACPVSRLGSKG